LDCTGDKTANFRQKGLPALTISSAVAGSDGQSIDVAWVSGNGQTNSYRLYRSNDPGGPFATLADLIGTSYVDAGLPCGASYYYEVAPVNCGSRLGSPSAPVRCANSLCLPPVSLQAPADGASVKPPDTFSWGGVGGATTYLVQVSHDPSFASIDWSTQTGLTSVLVPAAATPFVGSDASWRVRASNSQYVSGWATGSFHVAQTIALPALVDLSAPANGSVIPGRDFVLQWQQAPWATSYRLEVSSAADFAVGAGSTIVLSGITDLFKQVTIGAGVADVYWRVAGQNALGQGPFSNVGHFVLNANAVGVAGVAITEPATDVTVAAGAALSFSGLIVGRSSGPVAVQWLLDGAPIASQSDTLSGTGVDLSPVAFTPTDIGTHVLSLTVPGSPGLVSTRQLSVVQADFGAPTQLVVYADEPVLTAGESTFVFCTVRDANGRVVLSDNGRLIQFSASGGHGTLLGATQPTLNGVAFAIYRSDSGDSLVNLLAQDVSSGSAGAFAARSVGGGGGGGLPACNAQIQVQTELQTQRMLALGYLARLYTANGFSLDLNVLPPVDDLDYMWHNLNGIGNVVADLETFVRTASDVRRIRRLVLLLSMLNRAMYYGTATPMYPWSFNQPRGYLGLAVLAEEQAQMLGEEFDVVVETVLEPFQPSLLSCLTGLPFFRTRSDKLIRQMSQINTQTLYNARPFVPPNSKAGLVNSLANFESAAGASLKQAALMTTANLGLEIFQPGWELRNSLETGIAAWTLNKKYVPFVQSQLALMRDYLQDPNSSLGDDAAMANVLTTVLANVRTDAGSADASFKRADASFNSWQASVVGCTSLADKLKGTKFGSTTGDLLKSFGIGWVVAATGVAFDRCIADLSAAGNALRNAGTYSANRAAVALSVFASERRGAEKLGALSATHVADVVSDELGSQLQAYESAARAMELCLESGDTTCVASLLPGLAASSLQLDDAEGDFIAPFYAVAPSARYDTPAFTDGLDSLSSARQLATGSRDASFASIQSWLASPALESLRLGAVQDLRAGIDTSGFAYATLQNRIPAILGELGTALLVPSTPRMCRPTLYGDSVTVVLTLRNLGGAASVASTITLSPKGATLAFLGDSAVSVPALDPGREFDVAWSVRNTTAYGESDTLSIAPVIAAVDSGGSLGTTSAAALAFAIDRGVLGVGSVGRPGLALTAPSPNPSRGDVTFRFSLPASALVGLDVLDLAGRAVTRMSAHNFAAGWHDFVWDGRAASGHHAPPGVYFIRLETPGTRLSRVIIRLP
jgi:hypothetical protein